jgi:HlyD family secretion protein
MNTIKKRKSLIAILILAIAVVAGLLVYRDAFAKDTPAFRFVAVEKGDLQSKVSATGTLSAVTTVAVGTQVSGQVSELYADFNDHVSKGQLLARIDPTLAQQSVSDAQANVDKARAQLLESSQEFNRNHELLTAGLVAKSAYEQTQSAHSVASADVRSAEVALDRARQNLAYTSIYSPIDGVIIERDVQKGQTVAASLSAPQLFVIANDLTHMQILAQVGENDIAQIQQGQAVSFTVQALPNRTFQGTVQQVRLQSTTTDNVVNYTVVVAVDNAKNELLPGMTARVSFLTKNASGVLKISNAALRFKPTEEQLAELGAAKQASNAQRAASGTQTSTDGLRTASANGQRTAGNGQRRSGQRPANVAALYYLDTNGKLAAAHVRTGINDGTFTQIEGRNVTAGMKVIAGVVSAQTAQTSTAAGSSPFGSNGQQQRGQRPGGF